MTEMSNVSLKYSSKKGDAKILAFIIIAFLLVAWLCSPPGNKFAQMCFLGHNAQYRFAKLFNPEQVSEYKYHWQSVKYLADMDDKTGAMREMNKAISSLPSYAPESILYELYKDRGNLKLYSGNLKGALDDFLLIQEPNIDVKFKTALLLNTIGQYKMALKYCNDIVNSDERSYVGFACLADVYANAGKIHTSVKVFDLLIDRDSSKARYYVERALYKKAAGDVIGYNDDIAKAKEMSPMIDTEASIVKETLHPKKFELGNL